MNARSTLVVSCALVLAWAAGCGGDDDDGDVGLSVDDLPATISKQLCAEVETCFDARTVEQLFGDDGCTARFTARLEDGDFAHLQDAIDDGRIEYDSAQATRCVEALEGVGCGFDTTRLNGIEACNDTFVGEVELGDDCNLDDECAGDAVCIHDAGMCPGQCSELLAPGKACDRDTECEDGLTCDDAGRCTAPAEEGEPCRGAVAAECRAGLACIGANEDDGSAGTCRTFDAIFTGKLGDACDFDTGKLCEHGLSCIVKSVSGMQAQLECAQPFASGAACKFGAPTPCPTGEYCNANLGTGTIDGTCTKLPVAGQACAKVAGTTGCADGLLCDIDARCHPINRLGQPCASDQGCSSRRCVAGRCERPEKCE